MNKPDAQTIIHQALAIAEKWGEYVPGRSFKVFVELPDDLTIDVEFAETTVLVRRSDAILFQAHQSYWSSEFSLLVYVRGEWTEALAVAYREINPSDEDR